jgi:hypothetical protein
MQEHKITMTLEVTISTESDKLNKEEIEGAAYWLVQPAIESLVTSPVDGNLITAFN